MKWLRTFKRPEGILARWVETLAEFNFEIEHRPGRLHSNVDGVSRSVCKQCLGKEAKTRWVDELERADELTEPLGVRKNNECTELLDVQWADSVSNMSDDSEWSELSSELSEIDKPPCTNLSKAPTVNEHQHTELLDILRLNLVPEITDAEMAEMQAEDPNLGPIIEWLETNQIPNLETLKAHSLEVQIL